MVHLSVAIGRFVEALFWAILRAAGWVAVAASAAMAVVVVVFMLARRAWRRRQRSNQQ